jgi:hypothetical protein
MSLPSPKIVSNSWARVLWNTMGYMGTGLPTKPRESPIYVPAYRFFEAAAKTTWFRGTMDDRLEREGD